MKRIGIIAHSAEGAALCFLTACREGQRQLGAHMHPEIVMSAIPMGVSMPGWEANDFDAVAPHLRRGVEQVAAAGADFFVCPDNTAHLVLEMIAESLPIPGLHIAEVVAGEMATNGWQKAALLGTRWTTTGPVYPEILRRYGFTRLVPDEHTRAKLNQMIFEELCQGKFRAETTALFVDAIRVLGEQGADCAILGCTEIPLIVTAQNSPLPVLDSTRLLATRAVSLAITNEPWSVQGNWIACSSSPTA